MVWTEARVKAFIVGVLRQGMRRWPPKFQVLKNAAAGVRRNKLTKREAMHYKCAKCSKLFPRTGVQIDHINPVAMGHEWKWDDYIERLFCDVEGLQVLCKKCHKLKTAKDRKR
jgi:5-methylcytosine-specific restriction endonuclease McrA